MKIQSIDVLDDFKLKIRFDDSAIKVCDIKPVLISSNLDCFLRSTELFKEVGITESGISWKDNFLSLKTNDLYHGKPWLPVTDYIEPEPQKTGIIDWFKNLGK